MISAMPLMPMPPMPTKWIAPMSSGTRVLDGLDHACGLQLLHQIGEPQRGVRLGQGTRRRRASGERRGIGESGREHAGELVAA